MRFAHLICDCDGVLVDTELLAQKAEQVIFRRFGLEVPLDEIAALFTGKAADFQGAWLAEKTGGAITVAEYEALHAEHLMAFFQKGVEPVPFIREGLSQVSLPKSVATNGIRERALYSLGSTGLLEFFEGRINTVEDVARPKPAPDLYLLAAAKAGVAPQDCAVVEDSEAGVTAAAAAGMSVLGYVGLAHDREAAAQGLLKCGARAILSDMRALHTALDWL